MPHIIDHKQKEEENSPEPEKDNFIIPNLDAQLEKMQQNEAKTAISKQHLSSINELKRQVKQKNKTKTKTKKSFISSERLEKELISDSNQISRSGQEYKGNEGSSGVGTSSGTDFKVLTMDEVMKRRESFPLEGRGGGTGEMFEKRGKEVNIRVDQRAKDIRDKKARLELEEYKKNWELSHRRIKSNRSGIVK